MLEFFESAASIETPEIQSDEQRGDIQFHSIAQGAFLFAIYLFKERWFDMDKNTEERRPTQT